MKMTNCLIKSTSRKGQKLKNLDIYSEDSKYLYVVFYHYTNVAINYL